MKIRNMTMIAAMAAVCVLPYIIPDIAKLFLAWRLSERIGKHIGPADKQE